MSRRQSRTKLLLTDRVLRDIAEIESYSIQQWGEETATRYLDEIEAALRRLEQSPQLLRPEPDFHPDLRFYRVNKHVLVCDVQPKAIYVLTAIHASRDIPSRLAEMQPTLALEVELLHRQLKADPKRRR